MQGNTAAPRPRFLIGALVLAFAVVSAAFLAVHGATASSYAFNQPYFHDGFLCTVDNNQYAYLADALIHGKLNLMPPVPAELAQLPNPYDYEARHQLAATMGTQIYWTTLSSKARITATLA